MGATGYEVDRDRVLWERVDDTVTLLDLRGSAYHELNATAAVLWERIVDGAGRDDLVDALARDFDVDRDVAARDVDAFVAELRAKGFVAADA